MPVQVVKSDGTREDYSHNKVLLCLIRALCAAQEWDTHTARSLADAVTAHVYHGSAQSVSSTQVLAMVGEALAETGYGEAAMELSEHHWRRELARRRTTLVEAELRGPADAELAEEAAERPWSKSAVAQRLMKRYGLERGTARAVAGCVEERVLGLGFSRVWSGLLEQIEIAETAAMTKAKRVLEESAHNGTAGMAAGT